VASVAPKLGNDLMPTGKLIHVVDDDRGFRKGIERLLIAHGMEVRTFSSAEEFQAQADHDEPACIILDIHLTGMSGIELLSRLTRLGPRIPVVLVTASDSDVTRRAAMAAGCDAFLQKPFSSSVLMEALAEAVGPDRRSPG
jgi:FixJ family two-component response regulator